MFLKKVKRELKRIIDKDIKPAVKTAEQLIKTYPIIEAVLWATVGYYVAGPAFAFDQSKIGFGIGSLARSFIKACVPTNTMIIQCDSKVLISEVAKQGFGYAAGKVTGFS